MVRKLAKIASCVEHSSEYILYWLVKGESWACAVHCIMLCSVDENMSSVQCAVQYSVHGELFSV